MAQRVDEKELSLDIESLAQPSNDKSRKLVMVLAIGAVVFDPNEVTPFDEMRAAVCVETPEVPESCIMDSGSHFYSPVSLTQSLKHGFDCDPSTIEFWEKQAVKEGSYDMVAQAAAWHEPIEETMRRFAVFVKRHKITRIWAKSPSFDCTIMREAFNRLGLNLPIDWWRERDIRTLMDIGDIKMPFPEGFLEHHALHDAAFEATQVQEFNRRKRDVADRLAKLTAYEHMYPDEIIKAVDGRWTAATKPD